jgi:hypothetical protein
MTRCGDAVLPAARHATALLHGRHYPEKNFDVDDLRRRHMRSTIA